MRSDSNYLPQLRNRLRSFGSCICVCVCKVDLAQVVLYRLALPLANALLRFKIFDLKTANVIKFRMFKSNLPYSVMVDRKLEFLKS